jgi:hypothetical protein
MGPPGQGETTSSGQYDLRKQAVLQGLANSIEKALTDRGDKNVTVACKDVNATTAGCAAKGTNAQGQQFFNEFRVDVNTHTGQYTISNVQAAH